LRGDFGFDAASRDGTRLYVIHYRSRDHRRYAVELLRTTDTVPTLATVVEKGEPGERMSGLPVTRVTSRRGDWVYTLYDGGGGGHAPFIHALQTKDAYTICIDVATLKGRTDLQRLKLALAAPTVTITSADGAPLVRVNTDSFQVTPVSTEHAAKPAPPKAATRQAASDHTPLYVGGAGALLLVMALAGRALIGRARTERARTERALTARAPEARAPKG
jgi:hypothetical protein